MNPFDDFELDIKKISKSNFSPRMCDDPLNGSGGGGTSGPMGSLSCTCASCSCVCITEYTACASHCNPCSEDPKCQSLEGRCE